MTISSATWASNPRFSSIWSSSRPTSTYGSVAESPEPPRRHHRDSTMLIREFIAGPRTRATSITNTSPSGHSDPPTPPASSFRPTLRRQGTSESLNVFNSLKGRLKKRPSAPLLSVFASSPAAVPEAIDEQITPTAKSNPWPALDKSAVEFWTPPASAPAMSSASSRRSTKSDDDHQVGSSHIPKSGNDDNEWHPSPETFNELSWFSERSQMKVHPYPRTKAPYMQAYNRVCLDNDRYSDMLLRRLNDTGGPSFHDYGYLTPQNVLDLGCGQGTWALEAAMAWPTAKVIGFDLVDVEKDGDAPDNLTWKRGNYIDGSLPFPPETFDLVRMANLTLTIPESRWEHVLREVKRVLKLGGRLELIDDEMFFPYSTEAMRKELARLSRVSLSHSLLLSSSASDSSGSSTRDKRLSGESTNTSESESLFSRNSGGSDEAEVEGRSSDEMVPSLSSSTCETPESSLDDLLTPIAGPRPLPPIPMEPSEELPTPTLKPEPSSESLPMTVNEEDEVHEEDFQDSTVTLPSHLSSMSMERNSTFAACKELEIIFQSMLHTSYGIHSRPHMLFMQLLKKVFGDEGNARKIRSLHLAIPEKGFRYVEFGNNNSEQDQPRKERDRRESGAGRRVGWGSSRDKAKGKELQERQEKEWVEKFTDENLAQFTSEGKLNAKAAKLLGVALPKAGSTPTPSAINTTTNTPVLTPTRAADDSPLDFLDSDMASDYISAGTVHTLLPPLSASSSSTHLPISHPTPAPYPHPTTPGKSSFFSSAQSSPYPFPSEKDTKPSTMKTITQPIGLILFPDTLLTMPTSELYMHATKHMHVLLGCKAAVKEYTSGLELGEVGEESSVELDSDEKERENDHWEEAFWDYECSRHRRLNLPDPFDLDDDRDTSEDDDQDSISNTPSAPGLSIRSFSSSSNNTKRNGNRHSSDSSSKIDGTKISFNGSPGTYVRAIRVFEATKQTPRRQSNLSLSLGLGLDPSGSPGPSSVLEAPTPTPLPVSMQIPVVTIGEDDEPLEGDDGEEGPEMIRSGSDDTQ